jgi:hypothetical protein
MPATLRSMLRSLVKTKQTASLIELRFLREVARTLPTANAKESSKNSSTAKPRRTLRCPRCDRRFARPVHLGRHLSATHGRKKKRAA